MHSCGNELLVQFSTKKKSKFVEKKENMTYTKGKKASDRKDF